MTGAPDGWTEDMTITSPSHSIAEVVDFALRLASAGSSGAEICARLCAELALTPSDALLAWGRVQGGLVRARTRIEANRPDRENDPVAWEAFDRAIADPSLPGRVLPPPSKPIEWPSR